VAVYRNEATLARIRLLFVMVAVVGLGAGVMGLTRSASSAQGADRALWASIGLLLFGLAGLALVWRVARTRIETRDEGIVVRNVATTRHVAWSDIERFEENESRRGVTQAVVRTRSGKVYPLSGCGDPGPVCARILTSLRRQLEAVRRA
jgi:hypothetical protein